MDFVSFFGAQGLRSRGGPREGQKRQGFYRTKGNRFIKVVLLQIQDKKPLA